MRALSEEDIEVTDIGDFPNHEPTFQDPYNAAGNINTANSYSYDALGNMTKDATAGISAIDWTVAGKVKAVHREGGSPLLKLGFGYGASGQRIMKQVGEPGTDAGAYREHYVRDAQGNIMATYRYTISSAASLEMADRPIYGSARLGTYVRPMELYNAAALLSNPPPSAPIQKQLLRYELSDHLGNVTTTITGRLLASASSAPYEADLIAAQGLEPFGAILPNRSFNAANNLRLFQGQVRDDEIYGNVGLSYAFEYRMHDARVGRFWSVDPLASKYPHNSPYAFAENKVIQFVELEGLETAENHGNQVPEEAEAPTTKVDLPEMEVFGERTRPLSGVKEHMDRASELYPGSIAVGDMRPGPRNDYMDPYAKLLSCALVPLAAEFVLPAMVAESAPAMGWTSAARGGIDATLQTAGNYMAEPEGGLRGALAKVNWVQSGASAGGVFNIGGTAVIGSSFNLSVRDGPQITFADKQFSERLAVSAAFGGLGKRMSSLISRQNANGITLGVTLRTTLSTTPTFGLLAGRATHFGLTQGISLSTTLPESYLNADK